MSFMIDKTIQREQVIKKSRFICQLARVESEKEAQRFIEAVRADNPRAAHNCWVYVLGEAQETQRYSDDGEPTGTAGIPMLNVLKRRQLTNCCAVVTRYFGGIKLGASTLIRVYTNAVNQALYKVPLFERTKMQELTLTLDYPLYDRLDRFLRESDVMFMEAQFDERITVKIFVPSSEKEDFSSATETVNEALDGVQGFIAELTETFNGKITAQKGVIKFVETPV